MADAHHPGPMGGFFATICQTFDLVTPPEQLWEPYRRGCLSWRRAARQILMR